MSFSYVIITPAYNEQSLISATIESVLAQTILPARWVIVDDGSTDNTAQVVQEYCRRYPWMVLHRRQKNPQDTYYGSNVYAILEGVRLISDVPYEFLAILDADIELPADYYQNLLNEMAKDDKLGIVSGVYVDKMPDGALRKALHDRRSCPKALMLFRRACWEQIGGFVPMPYGGEDTVACFAARMHGWKTWSLPELVAVHLKPVGTGHTKGILKIRFRNGISEYYLASPFLFTFLKCVRRLVKEKPYFFSGLMRLLGYLYAAIFLDKQTLISKDLKRYIRKEQIERVFSLNRIPPEFKISQAKS